MTTKGQDSEPIDRGIGPNGLPPGPHRTVTTPNQVLYRICTEAAPSFQVNLERALADNGIGGCTLLFGVGFWEGASEASVTIEIVSDNNNSACITPDRIRTFALQLGQLGHQDSVLVQTIPLTRCEFVPMGQHSRA